MAKALSIDLRQRVVAAIDGGLSCRQAAERFWRQRSQCYPLAQPSQESRGHHSQAARRGPQIAAH